jgi:hypothetical protein
MFTIAIISEAFLVWNGYTALTLSDQCSSLAGDWYFIHKSNNSSGCFLTHYQHYEQSEKYASSRELWCQLTCITLHRHYKYSDRVCIVYGEVGVIIRSWMLRCQLLCIRSQDNFAYAGLCMCMVRRCYIKVRYHFAYADAVMSCRTPSGGGMPVLESKDDANMTSSRYQSTEERSVIEDTHHDERPPGTLEFD